MEYVVFVLPFNQPVKHIRVLCDHVQQLRVTGVGTEPAAVSPAVSVDWGKQTVFLTELVGIRLGHAVFGKQTDLRYSIQTSKAFWLILRDADIAHSVRRKRGIVLSDGRDFAVPIDRAHSSPRKTANLSLMRSAGDDVMEHVIVGLVCMENGELDAQLLFTEGLEPVIDEVPMFRDFTACVLIKHDLAENRLVQRLIVLCSQQERRYTVLASAARGNILRAAHRSNSILKLTYLPPLSSRRITAS